MPGLTTTDLEATLLADLHEGRALLEELTGSDEADRIGRLVIEGQLREIRARLDELRRARADCAGAT